MLLRLQKPLPSWLLWSLPTFVDKSPEAEKATALTAIGMTLVVTPSVPLFMHDLTPFAFKAMLCLIVAGHLMMAVHIPTLFEERRKVRNKVLPLQRIEVEPDEPMLEYRPPLAA